MRTEKVEKVGRFLAFSFGLFFIKTKMSASEQMRAMLDQLMGTSRNGESFLFRGINPKRFRVFDFPIQFLVKIEKLSNK